MSFELDATDVTSEKDLEGFDSVLPGRYHVMVEDVDDSFSKSESLILSFNVLAGTVPGQETKTHKEWVGVAGKAVKRAIKFAVAVNLMKPSDLGKKVNINWQEAIGRQLVIDLGEHEYEGKKRSQIEFLGFHAIGSDGATGVPLSGDVPSVGGGSTASPPAGKNGKASSGWDDIT